MEKMFEEMGAYIDAHRQEMVDKLVASGRAFYRA